jgi:hypothetical protein
MLNIPTANMVEGLCQYSTSFPVLPAGKTDISVFLGADFVRSSDKIERFLHLGPS